MSEVLDTLFVERLADEADYAIVGPRDTRTPVLSTRLLPYAAICHLDLDLGGRRSGCTGFLVAPAIVVTAAHCLHNQLRGQLGGRASPLGIRVTPGRNGALPGPFGSRDARMWFAHQRFVRARDPRFDIGIIVVSRPFNNLPGKLLMSVLSDAALAATQRRRFLHIAGYPGDKPRGTQWEHAESLRAVHGSILRYSVDTCPGHSGSPVWVREARGPRVIGIHTGGPTRSIDGRSWGCAPGVPVAPRGHTNRGVRITADLLNAVASAGRQETPRHFVRILPAASARHLRRLAVPGSL